jgi:cytochrome c553
MSVLRWAKRATVALTGLLAIAAVSVYARSEWILRRRWDIPASSIVVPSDPAAIALGERMATIRGCRGCHGLHLEGNVIADIPFALRLVAPNLAKIARSYSSADLERSIRHGVKPSGASVQLMLSDMFFNLSDADLGAIIAYLRSVTPATESLPQSEIRFGARVFIALGLSVPVAAKIDHQAARIPVPVPGDSIALGRYLVHTTCTECHGKELTGGFPPDGKVPAPNLVVAAAYSRDEFQHLLRTGQPTGGRTLRVMDETARDRLSHFTDGEIGGIYAYLRSRAGAR